MLLTFTICPVNWIGFSLTAARNMPATHAQMAGEPLSDCEAHHPPLRPNCATTPADLIANVGRCWRGAAASEEKDRELFNAPQRE
jgi:hypothetical protein